MFKNVAERINMITGIATNFNYQGKLCVKIDKPKL